MNHQNNETKEPINLPFFNDENAIKKKSLEPKKLDGESIFSNHVSRIQEEEAKSNEVLPPTEAREKRELDGESLFSIES